MPDSTILQSARGSPRGQGAFGAGILCLAGGWSRVRENPGDPGPSYPAVLPSKDRGSPPQGRPGVHSCCLLSWDRLALEQLLRPAPACGVLRNSIQSHTYSPHKVKGDKPGGDYLTYLVQRVKKKNSPRSIEGNLFPLERWAGGVT